MGEGCSVFERGERMGRKNSSIEWLFDRKAEHLLELVIKGHRTGIEYVIKKYFNMYHSYSNESEGSYARTWGRS